MSRPIDADALINELNHSHFPGAPYVDAGISIAIGKVCDAPTIEPEQEMADGCFGCAFMDKGEWDMPCRMCKRNCRDYWRAKPQNEDDE